MRAGPKPSSSKVRLRGGGLRPGTDVEVQERGRYREGEQKQEGLYRVVAGPVRTLRPEIEAPGIEQ